MNSIVPTPRRAKRDWVSIKQSYQNGEGSLRELSIRFGISLDTLEKRCTREGWRKEMAAAYGTVAATMAATVAEEGKRLGLSAGSLVERSVKLREQVVGEMEKDAGFVAKTPPLSLADAQARQNVLGSITRNAETTLDWGNKRATPCINLSLMQQNYVVTSEELSDVVTPSIDVTRVNDKASDFSEIQDTPDTTPTNYD